MRTTCANKVCPKYENCTFNIGADGWNCLDGNYMSQQQSIYRDYKKKCEAKNEEPMTRSEYFEF